MKQRAMHLQDTELSPYVHTAVELVHRHFQSASEVTCEVEHGREAAESWITLEVAVDGPMDEAIRSYEAYTDALLDVVPWPERDGIRLRFSII